MTAARLQARPAFVTYEELASVLGFQPSKPTLYRWMRSGAFPEQAKVPGCRRLMWWHRDLDAWVEAKREADCSA